MMMYVFFTYIYMCYFFLSLYTHVFIVCNLYFYFTLRCCDEIFLKCFRNTGCRSLLAINSLLEKFFKSLH